MPLNCDGEYGYLITQDLKLPATHSAPEVQAAYAKLGQRIHWVDSANVPGAFQMNTSWWFHPTSEASRQKGGQTGKPHTHPYPEILGFYGSNPEDPYDLGGEIELWINGEQHILTRSTMVFFPPNLPHCPLFVNRVDRPIFHFSVVMNELYSYVQDEKETVSDAR